MSDADATEWIITSTPQDNRHLPVDLYTRAFPPQPVFVDPPRNWPQPAPAPAAPAAARALSALDILEFDQSSRGTLSVPNAPGTAARRYTRPSAWDLVLIIDTGASMTAWYPTVNAFVAGTYRLALFADVHILKLHSQGFAPAREIFDGADVSNAGVDNSPRKKIILAITDGVGPAWRGHLLWNKLTAWAVRHPLAILHVQPHPHWPRSALHTQPLVLRSRHPGGSNDTIEVQPSEPHLLDEDIAPTRPLISPDEVLVPVLEFSKRWVDQWCRLLHSSQWVRQQAVIVPRETPPKLPSPRREAPSVKTSAAQLVVDFLTNVSAETAQLTTLLAAAPLNRHTMQLVASQLMPQTGPGNLAEILSSGLITVTDVLDPGSEPADQVVFDFRSGVRAELLARQREGLADCLSVARLMDTYLSPLVPAVEGLAQRIESLTPPDELIVTAENLPFLQVERAIFQAMPPGRHNAAMHQMGVNIDSFQRNQAEGSAPPY